MTSNRVFWAALAVSTLFHLSMVTVFKVYINLPAQTSSGNATRIHYASLDLVNTSGERLLLADNLLQLSPLTNIFNAAGNPPANQLKPSLNLATPKLTDTALPPIEFPTLELAELRLLQARELGVRKHEQSNESNGKVDAWGWLVRKIGSIQDRLPSLPSVEPQPLVTPEPPREPISRPVKGIALYIDWMNGPKHRDIVFSAPIDALLKLDPQTLTEHVSLVITVDPQGVVTKVVTPVNDENGIVASAAKAILKFQFVPLEDKSIGDQYGTLMISPDSETST